MHVDQNLLLIIAGAICLILLLWIIRLEVKLRNFLIGTGSKNLDDSVKAIRKELEGFNKFQKEEEKYLVTVEKRLKRSLQAVETVRFNPFKGSGTGGNQSFATAFTSEKGDGVIVSGLYAHDRMSIFTKPLENFSSTYELTDEEKSVIDRSKVKLKE